MRTIRLGLGALLGALLAATSWAQEVVRPVRARTPGVHRMEIYNGANRTVRYFGENVSPGDGAALRDLERAENESAYVAALQSLKGQYVYGEGLLDEKRRLIEQKYYGTSMTGYGPILTGFNIGGYGYGYGGGYGARYPYVPLYPNFGYGTGYYNAGFSGLGLAGGSTLTRSSAIGMGNEGVLKADIAKVVAHQATPEYAASVERDLDLALVRAASSPTISVALGLPDSKRNPHAFAAGESSPVMVHLKSGDRLRGERLEEGKEWTTLTLHDGRKVRVRSSEVLRIDEGKSGAIRPAIE